MMESELLRFFFDPKAEYIKCDRCGATYDVQTYHLRGRMIKRKDEKPEIIKLIEEHPDLPIVPMVDSEVVAEDCGYWLGVWGRCEVTEYYNGREYIHFRDDDEENVLNDMVGCKYGHDKDGRDIDELSDDEWKKLFDSLPWIKCIAVYITV